MKPTANLVRIPRIERVKRHPVKLTALFYLRDALIQEQYELCADFIAIAKEFGAQAFEIQNLLEDPRRIPNI